MLNDGAHPPGPGLAVDQYRPVARHSRGPHVAKEDLVLVLGPVPRGEVFDVAFRPGKDHNLGYGPLDHVVLTDDGVSGGDKGNQLVTIKLLK